MHIKIFVRYCTITCNVSGSRYSDWCKLAFLCETNFWYPFEPRLNNVIKRSKHGEADARPKRFKKLLSTKRKTLSSWKGLRAKKDSWKICIYSHVIEYDYFRLTIFFKILRKWSLYACVYTVNSPGYVLPIVSIKLSSNPAMMAPPTGTIKFLSKLWMKASTRPTLAAFAKKIKILNLRVF